jgi:hypothetical protein
VLTPLFNFALNAIAIYAGLGVCFGIYFIAKGAARLDPVAAHTAVGVRLIWIAGAVAVWPLLTLKLLRGAKHDA